VPKITTRVGSIRNSAKNGLGVMNMKKQTKKRWKYILSGSLHECFLFWGIVSFFGLTGVMLHYWLFYDYDVGKALNLIYIWGFIGSLIMFFNGIIKYYYYGEKK
jgi:hypothetical protein